MFERLGVDLARAAWKRAVVAGLLMGLAATLSYNMDRAGWVAGVEWWPGAWLALLGAAALTRTHWKGRWAFLYSLALIMAGAAELVGHVLPNLAQLWQAPDAWVLNLHLHAVTLAQRLQAWDAAIAHGQPVGDTGLFVWLIAVLEWGAVAWLAWAVLRRRQALAGCLPAAAILAINTRLSAQPWQAVLLFTGLMLALIIYCTYATQNSDWDRRGVDYPGELGLDWGTTAIALTLGIGVLSAAAPLVAAPSGWQLLGDMLASSRQQVAATADQLFTGVKPPSAGPAEPVARTPDLTSIGSAIDQSQGTVMWVKTDEPAPAGYPGARPPPQHDWRSGLYVTYTGTGWQSLQVAPGSASPPQVNGSMPPGRYAVRQQFQIVANHGQAQFAVNRPISATAGAFVGLDLTDDGTALLAGPASTYAVTSLATRASQAELGAAGTGYPDALRAAYLQLPPSLPARVASLAAQIANGATNPYDQALQLQAYLRNTYTYRLDVPPPPAGRDAVDYFLYEAPGGFCSYYASAMAVMLRTLGVPARVATGYAMGDYDSGRDAYRVAGAAAHAWVEVYFPAYGWVEFEPTPARAVFERPLGAGLTPTGAAPGSGAVASPSQASRVIAVVLGAAVTLLAAAGWVWWQLAARREPETPRRQVLRLYGRMRSALARAGLDAKPSVTADEYLAGRFDDLSARPSLLAAISEATALYRQAAYSPHPVSEASARAAQRLWEAARPAWIGLVFQWLAKSLRRNAR